MVFSVTICDQVHVTAALSYKAIPKPLKCRRKFGTHDIAGQLHAAMTSSRTK